MRLPDGFESIPAQIEGAQAAQRFYDQGYGGILIADGMGSGKTITALLAAQLLKPKRLLILTPRTMLLYWRDLTSAFLRKIEDKDDFVFVLMPRARGSGRVVITNYDTLRHHEKHRKLSAWLNKDSVIIMDECHRVKGNGYNPSQQAAAAWGYPEKKAADGKILRKGVHSLAKGNFVIGLSGTPMPNSRPKEIFYLMRHCLQPVRLGSPHLNSYSAYADQFCAMHKRKMHRYPKDIIIWDDNGASNAEEFTELLHKFMIRRPLTDFTDLPDKQRRIIPFPLSMAKKAQQQAYYKDTLSPEIGKMITSGFRTAKTPAGLMRTLKEFALFKAPLCAEHVLQLLEDDPASPVVVFGRHVAAQEQIVRLLKAKNLRVAELRGDTPIRERPKIVDEFQDGKYDVLVGSLQVASEGITLTRASRVVISEISFTPHEIIQAEDRVYRIGQNKAVQIDWITLDKSIDRQIANILFSKMRLAKKLLSDNPTGEVLVSMSSQAQAKVQTALFHQNAKDLAKDMGLTISEVKKWEKEFSRRLIQGETLEQIDASLINPGYMKIARWVMAKMKS